MKPYLFNINTKSHFSHILSIINKMKQYIYNHQNIKLNITSLGKSTTRFQSLLHFSNKIILPVTTSLVIYDLKYTFNVSFRKLKEIERK